MIAKFGAKECSSMALGERSILQLGWRLFYLKSLFDAKVTKEVKDIAQVQAMASEDGPLTYV